MTYHTNHCWCSSSHWNNKSWDGEVMVYFESYIRTDSLSYDTKVLDPDLELLTIEKEVFNQEKYLESVEQRVDFFKRMNKEVSLEDIQEIERKIHTKKVRVLKPEIIKWLEENIQNNLYFDKDEEFSEKGWCIGSDKYIADDRRDSINIFFARQIDALRFIKEFSIFKQPTFYFDYFNDDRREMDTQDILNITNQYYDDNESLDDLKLDERGLTTSKDLNPETYQLLDWEKDCDEDGYCDDVHLSQEEVKEKVKILKD